MLLRCSQRRRTCSPARRPSRTSPDQRRRTPGGSCSRAVTRAGPAKRRTHSSSSRSTASTSGGSRDRSIRSRSSRAGRPSNLAIVTAPSASTEYVRPLTGRVVRPAPAALSASALPQLLPERPVRRLCRQRVAVRRSCRRLVPAPGGASSAGYFVGGPSWSPDSSRLAYGTAGAGGSPKKTRGRSAGWIAPCADRRPERVGLLGLLGAGRAPLRLRRAARRAQV